MIRRSAHPRRRRLAALAGIGLALASCAAETTPSGQPRATGSLAGSAAGSPRASERPPGCVEAELVYDATQERLLMAGCVDQDDHSAVEQLWAWDGSQWALVDGNGPPALVVTGWAWDAGRDTLVRYGGLPMDSNTCVPETWEWHAGTWVQVDATPPTACDHHRLTFDAQLGRVIQFGGQDEDRNLIPETWGWDGSTWSLLAGGDGTEANPASRAHFGLVYDAAHRQAFLYGGYDGSSALDDFWSWDGTAWTDLTARYPGPGPRSHAGLAVGAEGLLLFGGATTGSTFGSLTNETWYLTDGAWSQLGGPGPSVRGSPALGYDPGRDAFVLYGGFVADGSVLADTWEWDGSWRCVSLCDGT